MDSGLEKRALDVRPAECLSRSRTVPGMESPHWSIWDPLLAEGTDVRSPGRRDWSGSCDHQLVLQLCPASLAKPYVESKEAAVLTAAPL
jgi:hypothetical protein